MAGTAPSGWQTPKTNWASADVILPEDMNRIEGNINAIEAGTRTVDPSQAPSSNQGALRQLLDWFANRIKAILGTTNWYDAPPTTLTAAKSHIDAAAPHSGHATTTALTAHTSAAAPHSGHETPAGAQAKANTAEANAKAYTDAHEQKAAPHSGHETPAGAQAKAEAAAGAVQADLDTHKADYMKHQWRKIATFDVPGAHVWTAPNLNNGEPYLIGAYLVGGGGSGASYYSNASSTNVRVHCTGGGSGYAQIFTMLVTPGDDYPVVIGAGGEAVSGNKPGNPGGSSAFGGKVAEGGGGGAGTASSNDSIPQGASGGTGSSSFWSLGTVVLDRLEPAPFCGSGYVNINSRNQGIGYPHMAFNPFDCTYWLGAGGSAYVRNTVVEYAQPTVELSIGKAGAGVTSLQDAPTKGEDATGYGNGGGAVAVGCGGTPSTMPVSGAGSGGVLFIYVRGL